MDEFIWILDLLVNYLGNEHMWKPTCNYGGIYVTELWLIIKCFKVTASVIPYLTSDTMGIVKDGLCCLWIVIVYVS